MPNKDTNVPKENISLPIEEILPHLPNTTEVSNALQDLSLFFEDLLTEGAWCNHIPTDVRIYNDLNDSITAINKKLVEIENMTNSFLSHENV